MDGMLILFLPGKRAKFFRKARRRRKFFPPFCFSSPIGNYCGGLILFGPFIRAEAGLPAGLVTAALAF
jgi:hypothetical protein